MIRPGDIFIDKDASRGPRPFKVVSVIMRNGAPWPINKDTAVCITRGKVTTIGINRLLDKSRFERSEPLDAGREDGSGVVI